MILRTKCTVSSNAWLIGAFNPASDLVRTEVGFGFFGGFFCLYFLVGEGIVIYI